jgi:phenylalanyl-tRNA synthetase beta chain
MGTHDYDKVKGPIRYMGMKPEDIVFKALKQSETMNASELFKKLEGDKKLSKYLHII